MPVEWHTLQNILTKQGIYFAVSYLIDYCVKVSSIENLSCFLQVMIFWILCIAKILFKVMLPEGVLASICERSGSVAWVENHLNYFI